MTTENALDPPPLRRRTGRPPYRRTAALIAGMVIGVVVIAVILHLTLGHSAAQDQATPARFDRGGASQQVQPPPAVTPQATAETRANLAAAQRAADSPKLTATHVQVATVSPPGGPAPRGAGLKGSSSSVGSSDG